MTEKTTNEMYDKHIKKFVTKEEALSIAANNHVICIHIVRPNQVDWETMITRDIIDMIPKGSVFLNKESKARHTEVRLVVAEPGEEYYVVRLDGDEANEANIVALDMAVQTKQTHVNIYPWSEMEKWFSPTDSYCGADMIIVPAMEIVSFHVPYDRAMMDPCSEHFNPLTLLAIHALQAKWENLYGMDDDGSMYKLPDIKYHTLVAPTEMTDILRTMATSTGLVQNGLADLLGTNENDDDDDPNEVMF